MASQKHLTLSDRSLIEKLVCQNDQTISNIAKQLNKDYGTIKREILKHRVFNNHVGYGRNINNCANNFDCPINKNGNSFYCNESCEYFEYAKCSRRDSKHCCCNGCDTKHKCVRSKFIYDANKAQNDYKETLSSSRQGINTTEEELNAMGTLINSLVKDKGQSINAVIMNNPNEFNVCSKTIYNYINLNLFDTRNIHLSRKVRFSPRKNKIHHKIDRNCTKGRTYEDFLEYMKNNPLAQNC